MHILWSALSPEAASNNLHKALYVARRMLEPQLPPRAQSAFVQIRGDFVQLSADGEIQTDVKAFTEDAHFALAAQDADACVRALELYTDDLLPEDRYEDWAIPRREHLLALRLDVLICLSRLRAAEGNLNEAIDLAQVVIAADPLNEEVHRHLILLLAQNGQRHLALQHYKRLCVTLWDELELEPTEKTREMIQQVIKGGLPAPHSRAATLPASPEAKDSVLEAPPLLGRDAELARVEQLLDGLYEGSGGLVLVRGEDGIGKSSLAAAVASRTEHRGIPVTWVRGKRATDNRAVDLRYAASRAPMLLVVDDPDDHELAVQTVWDVLATSGDRPVVVFMTLQLDMEESRTRLDTLAADLAAIMPASTLPLYPLEDAAVALIVRKLLGARASPAVIDHVRAVAEGNPHYATETVLALLGRGALHRVNGRWTFGDLSASIARDSLRRPANR
jgi:DNA-binding SARP family transcriptional activator